MVDEVRLASLRKGSAMAWFLLLYTGLFIWIW
jgi:hypothetical protein